IEGLKKSQGGDGTWAYDNKKGLTALAGLTLLECGVKDDDKAVTDAAAACRKVALSTLDTYSVSLIVLFLDRLDKPGDTPLIEACLVNLLAGQNGAGGWGYDCGQAFTPPEQQAILAEANDDKRALKGRGALGRLPAKGKPVATELPKFVQAKLVLIAKGAGNAQGSVGDNSNTQSATLALWAGRRYGVPTQGALAKVEARYRLSQ